VTTAILNQEFLASRERVQRMLTVSLLVHLALFAWLLLRQEISPRPEGIVEVAWLEPLPAPPPPAPVATRPEPQTVPKPVTPAAREEKFEREAEPAPVEPTPQVETVNRDRVKELATLSPNRLPTRALNTAPSTTKSLLQSAPAPAEDPGHKAATLDLKRTEQARPRPRDLTRGPEQPRRSSPQLAAAPTTRPAPSAAAVPDLEGAARRTLDGAELAGEIANRPVREHRLPVYPDWAKTQGVEASVTLYFVVLPDGRVKENIQVQKTAGFGDFDDSAMTALAGWRFAPLTGGDPREQWGTITFRFRLTD
jgi:TonB family protein